MALSSSAPKVAISFSSLNSDLSSFCSSLFSLFSDCVIDCGSTFTPTALAALVVLSTSFLVSSTFLLAYSTFFFNSSTFLAASDFTELDYYLLFCILLSAWEATGASSVLLSEAVFGSSEALALSYYYSSLLSGFFDSVSTFWSTLALLCFWAFATGLFYFSWFSPK